MSSLATNSPLSCRHAAGLCVNHHLISTGFNDTYRDVSRHAECAAIYNYPYLDKNIYKRVVFNSLNGRIYNVKNSPLRNSTIYVMRLYGSREEDKITKCEYWGLSSPCNVCLRVMKSYGIKRVIYTTGIPDNPIDIKKIDNIEGYNSVSIRKILVSRN